MVIRVVNRSSGSPSAFFLILKRSLSIRSSIFAIWRMFLFCECCEGLHSACVTGFIVIPRHCPLAVFRFSVDRPYSVAFIQERSGKPWFVSCRPVLLDAVCDPGDGNTVSSGPPVFLLPASVAKVSALPTVFRGYLPDSASFASPRNLSSAPCFGFGWLTTPFPAGYPPARLETISRSTATICRRFASLFGCASRAIWNSQTSVLSARTIGILAARRAGSNPPMPPMIAANATPCIINRGVMRN